MTDSCRIRLTIMIGDKDIEAMLQYHLNPKTACRELIATANAAGGTDNLTVITIDYHRNARYPSVG